MSRGHGRWQREVLAAAESRQAIGTRVIARLALGREPTRSERVAVRRAAGILAAAGSVELHHGSRCERCGMHYADQNDDWKWHGRDYSCNGVPAYATLVSLPGYAFPEHWRG